MSCRRAPWSAFTPEPTRATNRAAQEIGRRARGVRLQAATETPRAAARGLRAARELQHRVMFDATDRMNDAIRSRDARQQPELDTCHQASQSRGGRIPDAGEPRPAGQARVRQPVGAVLLLVWAKPLRSSDQRAVRAAPSAELVPYRANVTEMRSSRGTTPSQRQKYPPGASGRSTPAARRGHRGRSLMFLKGSRYEARRRSPRRPPPRHFSGVRPAPSGTLSESSTNRPARRPARPPRPHYKTTTASGGASSTQTPSSLRGDLLAEEMEAVS